MYKQETINNLMRKARKLYKEYSAKNICDVKISISKGNRKIGRVMNASIMPVMTCANCKECMHYCYDIKACIQYPHNVLDARIRNTVLAMTDRDLYFGQIEQAICKRRKNKYFRWHVAGDILDIEYLKSMVDIANRHEDFIFWTYTKNYKVVNTYCDQYGKDAIPKNLSIMFSEWDGLKMDNSYNFPVFACRLKDGNKNRTDEEFSKMHKCPGNCDICKENKRGCPYGESTFADEH